MIKCQSLFPAQKSPSLVPRSCGEENYWFLNKACGCIVFCLVFFFLMLALYPNLDATSILGSSEVHVLFFCLTLPPLISPSPPARSSFIFVDFYITHVTFLPCYLKQRVCVCVCVCVYVWMWKVGGWRMGCVCLGEGGGVFGSSAASLSPSVFLFYYFPFFFSLWGRRGCSLIGEFGVRQIT